MTLKMLHHVHDFFVVNVIVVNVIVVSFATDTKHRQSSIYFSMSY